MRQRLMLVSLGIIFVLAGCGGGGGGSSSPPPSKPASNTAPVFTATSFSVNEDVALSAAVTAIDAQGNAITFALITNASHGTVSNFSSSGGFTYLGASNFSGSDSFTVSATDSAGAQATATVTVTVAPVNDVPTLPNASFTCVSDSEFAGSVSASDVEGSAIAFTVSSNPMHGQLVFAADGTFTYRPTSNYSGLDTFDVRATDADGGQATATISMTVTRANRAPTIRDDVITASGSSPLIDVLTNDTEPDGEMLSLTLVGAPDFGTAAVEGGRIRLTLPAGFQGFNTLTYRAVDPAGVGSTARAAVFVDTEPVRFIYLTNEEGQYAHNIYADDLLSRRRITSFDGNGATALGSWMLVSKNGRSILYDEIDNTNANSGRRFWTAAAVDGSAAPRHINSALTAGSSIELASELSPDGRWVVYRIRDANFVDRFYLVDITNVEPTREILPPTGAVSIEASGLDIVFDEQSQYYFVSIREQLSAGEQGITIYRAPLNNPSALQRFFSPAVANRSTYAAYVDVDGSRAIVISFGADDARLYLTRAADPAHPIALSPPVSAATSMMGSYRVDWAHDQLVFNVDSLPGAMPYSSTLHLANLTTGVWTALGNLPGDFTRPEFIEVHPSGSTVLLDTKVNDPVRGIADEVREVDLVAGAPTRLIKHSDSDVERYTNAGATVLVAYQGSLQAFPRSDVSHPKTLFTDAFADNYRFSADGKIVSVSSAPWTDTFASDSVWAVNQTTAPGTFAKRLVQVTNTDRPYVSVAEVVPRY
ncbi:MAG: Ig-like domain-containing protein [Povalibacter sp.]